MNGEFAVFPNPITEPLSNKFVVFDIAVRLDWIFEGSEPLWSFEVAITSVEIDVEAGSAPVFGFDFVDDSCHELSGVVLEGDLSSLEHRHYDQHDCFWHWFSPMKVLKIGRDPERQITLGIT